PRVWHGRIFGHRLLKVKSSGYHYRSYMQMPNGNTPLKKLKVCQINAENLFLFFDAELPAQWKDFSEKEWQKLSHASVTNKSLRKTLALADGLLSIDADFVLVNEVGGQESLDHFARYFLNNRYKAYVIEGN